MMKQLLFICITTLVFFGCAQPQSAPQEQQQQPPAERTELTDVAEQPAVDTKADDKDYVDSFKIKTDSLMTADIELPPVYKHEIITSNNDAVTKFSNMAKASKGSLKVLVNSTLVAKELVHTINEVSRTQSDLLILIDKTGSMGGDIDVIRKSLKQIIDTIKRYKGTRVAIGFYGDKNCDGMGWYKFQNFEMDYVAASNAINELKVGGGGDWPESVYDAVMKSLDNEFWQSPTKRNIILIGDAPPLEAPLSDYTMNDVLLKAKNGGVRMNFYPIIITPTVEAAVVEKVELDTYKKVKLMSSVYPNPCNNVLNVNFEEGKTYFIEIYNAAGEEVLSEEFYGLSWSKRTDNLPDGFYVLRAIGPDHRFEIVKFIVKH